MTLHEFCLASLNHDITQALACGKRLEHSQTKNIILSFGLLHLFVVSGAHLILIQKTLSFLKLPKHFNLAASLLLTMSCNFSAPILRVFVQQILQSLNLIHMPRSLLPLLSFLLCLPTSYYMGNAFSLGLSYLFGQIIRLIDLKKSFSQVSILTLAFPIFFKVLGIPHLSSIFLMPLAGTILCALLPLSLISIFSNSLEAFTIKLWWFFEDNLSFINTFYNYPKAPKLSFSSLTSPTVVAYAFVISVTTYLIGVQWKRSSYSL